MKILRIAIFIALVGLSSCNIYKIVPEGKYLLRKNKIVYKEKEVVPPKEVRNYILQQPNFYVFGYPLWVGVYSIADVDPVSHFERSIRRHPEAYRMFARIFSEKQVDQLKFYYVNLNRQIQKFGEAPVLIDTHLVGTSRKNLHVLFRNKGFLDNRTTSKIRIRDSLKADVYYRISEQSRYSVDSVYWHVKSAYLAKLLNNLYSNLYLRPGKFFQRDGLASDREKITGYFRNHGIFDFQSSFVKYDVIKKTADKKVSIHTNILNKVIQKGDSLYEREFIPFRYDKVSVRVITSPKDSLQSTHQVSYDKVDFYYPESRYFRPSVLRNSVFINPGDLYSDVNVVRTRRQLFNLQNFKQIYIRQKKEGDSLLRADITLVPLKKYGWGSSFNITHSSIRPVGLFGEISGTWRNMFHGFENLRLSYYFQLASSKRFTGGDNTLFNVRESGLDLTLSVPRVVAPLAGRWIKSFMEPVTTYSLRYTSQKNVGLDREKFYGIYAYQWKPNSIVTNRLSPVEVNYVQYKNPERYFFIYTAAFHRLKKLAEDNYNLDITQEEAQDFINFVLSNEDSRSPVYREVKKIYERKIRLTENIFIQNSNFSIIYDTRRRNIWQNNFYQVKWYFEITGWIPGALSKFIRMPVNNVGQRMLNKIPYAQYYKTELSYVRHIDFGKKRILALRLFGGLAVPFGNSTNIPFVSAYLAGGSSDVRAWRAFELGPGSTGGLGEFNEANMKLLAGAEWRMPVYENHHIGVFVDAGNIWNIFDDTPYREAKFKGWYSLLHETAIGSGIGYRYDFSFFAIRLDLAFKNFDPGLPEGQRWINDYNIRHAILQFGINYPF